LPSLISSRLRVLDPYRVAFDPKHSHGSVDGLEAPPHKYLFHCYMYEYHTLQIATLISGTVCFEFPVFIFTHLTARFELDELINLEKSRQRARLWIPTLTVTFLFWWNRWNETSDMDRTDDEDPGMLHTDFLLQNI
jgi:hypothetical protein